VISKDKQDEEMLCRASIIKIGVRDRGFHPPQKTMKLFIKFITLGFATSLAFFNV
jgi:hypothetical protein